MVHDDGIGEVVGEEVVVDLVEHVVVVVKTTKCRLKVNR